jgi:hypothetical protein
MSRNIHLCLISCVYILDGGNPKVLPVFSRIRGQAIAPFPRLQPQYLRYLSRRGQRPVNPHLLVLPEDPPGQGSSGPPLQLRRPARALIITLSQPQSGTPGNQ